ncbi:BREX-1 system adenine-specific DNA-methyltransferase PglX [Ligilactobacillus ceti]|uniref:site-specific DNA-methyltransferase (adenine-specific) n=1 Tax=Ligilactobacillus ceti DSM 22408 TaxID=1122146 RepID=A0A0R2KR63_9LACO|nr:BREX-1 system adenine-specific DNA-methyltransferase PglX [Ligilactobacillus ceti]KRN88807.1 type ii restriction enzyme, methylase subunit [Ligilactobacillus ceti DSM 22408]
MNKTAIKNFAIWARQELIASVKKRAKEYEIEKDNIKPAIEATIQGKLLSLEEKRQRQILIEKIEKDGFDETVEEVAYTWFNRFVAIRFMEVNGYLPSHIRVFSSENGDFSPEILTECLNIDMNGLDQTKVLELYQAADKEALFRYLFITQCNALSDILPGMFEEISDYTELLLPTGLLKDESVLHSLVVDIPEEDFKEQVQIIGWMYQYYNTEPKDEVFSRPKSKKINKEDIPAVTQLFTPDWIVKYMVENSLGRLWLEGHPNESIQENWRYYIAEAEQEPQVEEKLKEIRKEYELIEPVDIKCIDPSIGSGHITCYLFDVLIQIYESYGYRSRDAAKLIIENNIYGLDIDERARQLAYFSVMMKARQYDRRFLSRKDSPQPKIYAIDESNLFITENGKYALDYFIDGRPELSEAIHSIVNDMIDAKEYGSIIDVKQVDFKILYDRFDELINGNPDMYSMFLIESLLPLVKQAEILSQKYDVVVTNPPYMGGSGMNKKLSKYVKDNYKDSKSDLFAVFIEKWNDMIKPYGFNAMVTMQSWMFLSSYEKFRKKVIENMTISNLMHMDNMVMRIAFGTAVTVFRNMRLDGFKGTYNHIKLEDIIEDERTKEDRPKEFPVQGNRFAKISTENFKNIPGMSIAYWASDSILDAFEHGVILKTEGDTRQGMATSDNNRFLRLWQEVDFNKTGIGFQNSNVAKESKKKWFPYNKGGEFRKWYGNIDYLINYENDGKEVKDLAAHKYKSYTRTIKSISEYYKKCLSWSKISSGSIAFRFYPEGFIFDVAGCCIFYKKDEYMLYDFALLNSNVSKYIFSMISPTLNYETGHIASLPVIRNNSNKYNISEIIFQNISLAMSDWDMHETSWDFEKSPLLANKQDGLLSSAYESYKEEINTRFATLKANEEELNRIFIEIYGLEDELTPEVSDKDITVSKIFDNKKDIYEEIKGNKYILTKEDVIKNFLSYFIGCSLGRYSLDEDGLIYAGGEFDPNKYTKFPADEDGIIPFTDKEYFEDDVLVRLRNFLKITFGEETVNENLDFIASVLKGKASDNSTEKIRAYFMNDFYKEHVKKYKKRPIYWLADSGKLGSSRNLIYMHRYQKDTIARLRIRYLFEIQDRYKQELEHLEKQIESASSDKVTYQKQANRLKKLILETEKYEEKVQHFADASLAIDLDDGVKENYAKFKDILAKI